MSHVVQIQTEVRDAIAAAAGCYRLGLPQPVHSTYELFSNQAVGLGVQLPDWHYPVVCDLTSGQVQFDSTAPSRGIPAGPTSLCGVIR